VELHTDTPILSGMIIELGQAREEAWDQADALARLLADVEALHEPDANGDCPTCATTAPCLTHLLIRREITMDQAYSVVRDNQPIDLVAAEAGRPTPPVPSLSKLLAAPTPGLDRFFDALLHAPVSDQSRSLSPTCDATNPSRS
jgi:hypothetical protein